MSPDPEVPGLKPLGHPIDPLIFNRKTQCPGCQGTVFNIIGFFYQDAPQIRIQCANYHCPDKDHIHHLYAGAFELIEKGSYCRKCQSFEVESHWDKNKQRYIYHCYKCGDHEEEEH